MRAALVLARRGLGQVWPNPAVGCVIVKDRHVVGRGWTQQGGRPHAETEAIKRAGDATHGATAYVTLEPCSHHGESPPCADALVEAGVARVVTAMNDPDPRVAGQGLNALRAATIEVEVGVCGDDARALNRGYLKRLSDGLPLVTLKTAITTDGRIATKSGESQWITGAESRAEAHRLRADHDAITVASATAIADDPELTCRLPGMQDRSPVRVLLDAHLRVPTDAKLYATAHDVPLWVFSAVPPDDPKVLERTNTGAEHFTVATDGSGHGVNLRQSFGQLAQRGITRLLAEAGGMLASALLRDGLVDDLAVFRAPKLLGGDGIPMIGPLGIGALDQHMSLHRTAVRALGNDVVETFRLAD
jgi:diaminohydroxyphosphoribosylaminopyrimidine deaminase/5-amino-6-(5-phosphoribosylamino)uracil reductase